MEGIDYRSLGLEAIVTRETKGPLHLLPRLCTTDVLLDSDSNSLRVDARLDFGAANDYAYREGYRRAGRILAEWVEANGDQNFLVFPICHAYRHFVELTLKLLVVDCVVVIDRAPSVHESKILHEHDLRILWETFKLVAAEVGKRGTSESPSPQDLEGISVYMDQLHAVDPGSFAFRYKLTKSDAASSGNAATINLGQFCSHMESLCAYLNGCEAYYQHLIRLKPDALEDYESAFEAEER